MASVAYEVAAETEVREALDRFTEAVNSMLKGDPAPMEEIWSHSPDVTLLTPFGGRHVGWEAVKAHVYEMAKERKVQGRIESKDVLASVHGDIGFTVSRIFGPGMKFGDKRHNCDLRATSIFRREDNQWRLVHHHADQLPPEKI